MESALRNLGNFVKTGDGTAEVYLHAFDEHINANTSQRDINHVLETTNFLLSKAKTRNLGMEVLDKVLPWINQEILEQKIQLWTTFILKACNQDELQKYGSLIYKTLTNLIEILRQYPELSKNFGTNHLTKVYETIILTPTKYYKSALKCAEACLKTYSKPNGKNRESMERFLMSFLDRFDDQTNNYVGRCLHYLQLTTVPSSKDLKTKEQWKSYQLTLIDNLVSMIDEAYAENNNRSDNVEKIFIKFPALKLSTDPNERAAQLFVRFHNLNNYLKIALCEPNLDYKPIVPKRILNLITRGLIVTCAALNRDSTYSKIAFGVFLPKIQLDLLDLSKVLIRTLQCHLRIYYKSLLGCLIHVLKSTTSANATIRAEVYEVIELWCQTLSEGSRCELYADELIPEILKDLTPIKNELISQIKTNKKYKKPYKPLQAKQIKIQQNASDNQKKIIYSAPIKCLKAFLKSCSNFLKSTTITLIQTSVLKICSSFLVTKRNDAYNHWKNRLEMYNLLQTLLMTPNQYSPPATQIILYLLQTARISESNAEIRNGCSRMIIEIEKIVHPQKESLIIPIEARTIRNAFSRLGQEAILEQSQESIAALRFKYDGNVVTNLTDEVQPIRVEDNQRLEVQIDKLNGVENGIELESPIIEDKSNEISKKSLMEPTDSSLTNANSNLKNKKKILTDSDDDSSSEIKTKRKKMEPLQASPIENHNTKGDESENSAMDTDDEDLRPVAPVKIIPTKNANTNVENKTNKSSAIKQDDHHLQQEKKESKKENKNEADEIAEMESFFVDELKSF